MVEVALRGYRTCNDWIEEPMRAALDAIAPMVEKWVGDLQASGGEMMREAGYRAGYNQAVKDLN